jgi:hypothetical protein
VPQVDRRIQAVVATRRVTEAFALVASSVCAGSIAAGDAGGRELEVALCQLETSAWKVAMALSWPRCCRSSVTGWAGLIMPYWRIHLLVSSAPTVMN